MIVTKVIEKRYELTLDEKEMQELLDIVKYYKSSIHVVIGSDLVNKILEIE